MVETTTQVRATAEEDLRYSSRKWILTRWSMALYTVIHLMNAGMLLVARHNGWLDQNSLQVLWSSSLTIWSIGIGTIIGLYFGVNLGQKFAEK